MGELTEKFLKKIAVAPANPIRGFVEQVDWRDRMIGIKGARGVGKTTLLLQYIRQRLPMNHQTLYVSLDDIYFADNTLVALADRFTKNGGTLLVLDEVHRYPRWSLELKNIYDDHPNLKVIFIGSSALHLHRSKADLSRRAVMYHMPGLSFREFLRFAYQLDFPWFPLPELLNDHIAISMELIRQFRPLPVFNEYLTLGYYPYFLENRDTYHLKLAEVINLILEIDLPHVIDINLNSVEKIRRLLYVLAESSPFKPNIVKLSEKVGVTRNTIIAYLEYLQETELLHLLRSANRGVSAMQKPEKVYLQNPNLFHAIAPGNVNAGSLRETFFYNQLQVKHTVQYSNRGDFLIDNRWTAEIGGESKGRRQLAGIEDRFVAAADLEIGYQRKIPLWLFGFLY